MPYVLNADTQKPTLIVPKILKSWQIKTSRPIPICRTDKDGTRNGCHPFASRYSRDKAEVLQCFHDGCFLFFGADARLSGAGVAIIVVLMLTDAQFLTNLSNVSRVNLEAILVLDILLNIIVGVDSAHIGFQILGVDRNVEVIADLFPT